MLYSIYITKSGELIGVFNHTKRCSFLDILCQVFDIIDNYNKNLISRKLPTFILAHRMLQIDNAGKPYKPLNSANIVYIFENSYKHAIENYPAYEWKENLEENTKNGSIALIEPELSNLSNFAKVRVGIDIDTKRVVLKNFLRKETKDEYCKRRFLREDLFYKKFLPKINIEEFSFNELEDIYDFLQQHKVWQEESTDLICSLNENDSKSFWYKGR